MPPREVKRKPGRPKGAKNKPKPGQTPMQVVLPPEAAGDSLTDARNHITWVNEQIVAAGKSGASPKEVASLSAQKTALLRHIATLTGAYNVTESKIVRSEPFARLMSELMQALEPFPEAVAALQKWREKYP